MRPQGHALLSPNQDDLGWNDMGSYEDHDADNIATANIAPASYLTPLGASEAETPAETPLPAVLRQQQEIEQEFSVESVAEAAPAVVATPAKPKARRKAAAPKVRQQVAAQPARSKAAFTLRLDAERHLRLRLACAMGHRSAQRLLINALDAYLDDIPGLDALASSLPNGHA
ncbi:hypothetical protein ACFB49_20810 [Sphingomonas sp. DBB INV C78]